MTRRKKVLGGKNVIFYYHSIKKIKKWYIIIKYNIQGIKLMI